MTGFSPEDDYFVGVIQHLPVCAATTDARGIVRSVNGPLASLIGFSAEDAAGQPISQVFFSPEFHFPDIVREANGTAPSWRGQTVCRRKNGTTFAADLTLIPHRDSEGSILHVVAVIQALPERKQAEESLGLMRERLDAVERTAGAGTWALNDPTGQIEGSQGWARLHGLDPQRTLHSLDFFGGSLHAEDRDRVLAEFRAAFQSNTPDLSCEYRVALPDGRVRNIRASGKRISDDPGQRARMTGACVDITERLQGEAFAAEAQRDFERFFNLIPDLACIVSNDGYFKKVNPAWETTLGYTMEEVLASPMLDFIHPEDRERSVNEVAKQSPVYRTRHFINRYRCKNGSYRLFDWTTTFNRDDSTRFGVATDITERRMAEDALRESEERFRIMADSCPTIIWVTDAQGSIRIANRMCREFLGPLFEQTEREHWDIFLHPDDRAAYTGEFFRALAERAAFRAEARVRRADGEWRWIVSYAEPRLSQGGEFLGYVGISPDITDRKQSEEALQKAKESAEGANRYKSEFLANMSHEIRTPMNGIIGLTDLVLDSQLNPEQRGYLEIVKHSADSLLRIINDILDFSKIEAGKLEFEAIKFDLRQTVEAIVKVLANRATAKGLELVCDIGLDVPTKAIGDPGRLQQIFVNLIGNSIKFTERGEVVVSAERLSETDSEIELCFSVTDTGVGIPPSKQQHVFSAFAQVDSSSTRTFGGTGLGLTISSQLVEKMGGRIWLESEVGVGSHFHFTVRLGKTPSQAADELRVPASLKGVPVLIVDDNDTNRRILDKTLSTWGMNTITADSGSAALETLKTAADRGKSLPVMVLDVQMPGMDGLALAEHVKEDRRLNGTQIVFLTSGAQTGEAERCRDLGALACLAKPVSGTDLLSAMGRMFDPAAKIESSSSPRTPHVPQEGAPRLRLLVVEDNSVNRLVATRMLEKQNHTVRQAIHGREALDMLEAETFDCVLMDVQMPVLDGFQATAMIREKERITGGHIPIVAMTAHAMEGDLERCLASGMDGYIAKPIKGHEVAATIKRVLSSLNVTPPGA